MRMLDVEGKLKSLLWAQFIHVDIRLGRSIAHSEELQEIFDKVVIPREEMDFNLRLKFLNS
jgi:hypothetical protein